MFTVKLDIYISEEPVLLIFMPWSRVNSRTMASFAIRNQIGHDKPKQLEFVVKS